jgi:hypothetical protein
VFCAPENPKSPAQFEAAAAADPQSLARQLDLARCYDTAWRFADGERAIGRAIELTRAIQPAPKPVPLSPIVAGADEKARDFVDRLLRRG